jgi:hypothetical protein
MRRTAIGLALTVAAALAVPAGQAQAAGTGGIEVSPYPGISDGRQVTAFHVKVPSQGDATVQYSVRNTTDHAVTGRMYAASATPDGHGGWTIGGPASTPTVGLADQKVALKPKETRVASFRVEGSPGEHAAVVVEVKQGAVVTRAATLVYLEKGRSVPVPLLVVGAAVVLLLLVGAGLVLVRRRPAP